MGFLLLGGGFLHAQLVTTIAGQAETIGNTDGDALTQALFNNPHGICMDGRGYIYIADRWNHKIRILDTQTGIVNTLAGTGQIGDDDGIGSVARFYEPWGITCSADGTVYVADTKNYLIRKIDTLGNVTTIAGSGAFGVQDGPALSARFAEPSGIALADDGSLYICDHIGHTIRKLNTGGVVTTIAGQAFVDGDVDGAGPAARFYRPFDIDMDLNGNILVADEWNHKIRRVTPTGFTTTIAGSGNKGSDDGHVNQARFNFPWDVLIDSAGAIYVMDGYNYTIRKIEEDTVSTYCGTIRNTGAQDGFGDQASFSGATAICYDPLENQIYVADAFNELIRRVSPSTGVNLLNDLELLVADTLCVGTSLTFNAMPADYASYDFYVDGSLLQSNTSNEFTYTFNNTGSANIKVTATHADGWTVESEEFNLFAVPAPDADFIYEIQQSSPESHQIRFLPSDTLAQSYFWNFGDPSAGTNNYSTQIQPVHIYPDIGPYSVELVVSNGGSCLDTVLKQDYVGVLGLEVGPIQAGDTLCLGESLSFTASTEIYDNYRFFLNDSEVQNSTSTIYTLTPADAGDYRVFVEGMDSNGQVFQSVSFPFVVSEPPQADFTAQLLGRENDQYRVDFIDMSIGARRWNWTFGEPAAGLQNISSIQNPTHHYSNYGRYNLKLIVNGAGNCADTLQFEEAIVIADLQGNRENVQGLWEAMPEGDTLCIGDAVQLQALPGGFTNYEFYQGNTLLQQSASDSYIANLDQSGWYQFRFTGVEADGRRIVSLEWRVFATPEPTAEFKVVDQRISPQGLIVSFAPEIQTYKGYQWDFGDPTSGTDNRSLESLPTHTFAEFGLYDIELIVDAGGGCQDTLSKPDAVYFKDEPGNLFVPNAFTPNGDGSNDILHLYGNNIVGLDWSIYNEWGELVFQTRSPGEGWDGTFRGKTLPSDTYVFMATVSLANGQIVTLNGQTTLLR